MNYLAKTFVSAATVALLTIAGTGVASANGNHVRTARNNVKTVRVSKTVNSTHKAADADSIDPNADNGQSSQSNGKPFHKIYKLAKTKLHDPYELGAEGPHRFDCSGFVKYLYAKKTNKVLPRTAQAQYNDEKHVKYHNAKPGNLVFFGASKRSISHVGMFIGKGKMIDAQNRGVVTENVKAPWWHLVGCAKVIR